MKINTELTMEILEYTNKEISIKHRERLKIYYNTLLYGSFNNENSIFISKNFLESKNKEGSLSEIEILNFERGRINLKKLGNENLITMNILRIYNDTCCDDTKESDFNKIFYEFDYFEINIKDKYFFEISNCQNQFISIFFNNKIVYHFLYKNKLLKKIEFEDLKFLLNLYLFPILNNLKSIKIEKKEISNEIKTVLNNQLKISKLINYKNFLQIKEKEISNNYKNIKIKQENYFDLFLISLSIINLIVLINLFLFKIKR